MTVRGVVKNGVIFLLDEVTLPDGLEVRVQVKRPSKRDWDAFFRHCVGIADDDPQVSRNIHDYVAKAVEKHARSTKTERSER
jgi:predicted DNA-binding antitoxin AbrB/MazE fold protein